MPDQPADRIDVRDARQLDDDAVRALDHDDRLGHAGRVHPPLDDVLDDAHPLGGRRHAVLGQRLVLDPETALEVEPELGLDQPPLAVRGRRIGQAEVREEVDEEGEDADDDDDGGAGSTHTGGMVHGTSPTRRPASGAVAAASRALRLQRGLDPLRQGAADARDGGDLLDGRLTHPLDRAEDLEQLPLPLRADAGQVVERRADRPPVAQGPVVGDREPMRLVAQPLDEVERR